MAKVLNIKKCGYKIPDGAVYVGRASPKYKLPASKWGNPYKVGIDGTREEVIAKYHFYVQAMRTNLRELEGKDLVCWCHTWDGKGENPRYCHADILLELANC